MDTKFIVAAQRQLENEKKKQVTPAARIMLEAILIESLTTRESEWLTRPKISLGSYGSENQLSASLAASLNTVLDQACNDQSGEFITTRDVLSAIQKKWCGIFPIC
jgi:hypothetical protein